MSRTNKPHDVFKYIDMKEGDPLQCWPWLGGCTGEGRPTFTLAGKKVLPYRLVFELVNGVSIPPGVLLRHKCDNMVCCNPQHHELGTHQQNMNDMKERERHGLPAHTIKAIRKLLEKGETHESIAEKFGVDRNTIGRIHRGEAYSGRAAEQGEVASVPGSDAPREDEVR